MANGSVSPAFIIDFISLLHWHLSVYIGIYIEGFWGGLLRGPFRQVFFSICLLKWDIKTSAHPRHWGDTSYVKSPHLSPAISLVSPASRGWGIQMTDALETLFFVKTVIHWNHLEDSVINAESPECFCLPSRATTKWPWRTLSPTYQKCF